MAGRRHDPQEATLNDTPPSAPPSGPDAALRARRERSLGPSYRLFYDQPFHPVRASGVWMYDADGTAHLDVYNNVPCVGHCHPRVLAALTGQAALLNTHTRYLHDTVVTLAERLLEGLPAPLDRMVFACTGSEANDLALRIARHATGGSGIVVSAHAYHGVTLALAEISPALGLPAAAHVRTVPPPDSYRDDPARFADRIAAAFADLRAHGHTPSALILDTVFSSDGVVVAPPGVLAAAAAAARAAGALVIADEVQAGHARTGDRFWGFAAHDLTPDMVSMGKPMGAGHPVAALAVRHDLIDGFGRTARYFNTFGGNPVSAAVALAVLDVIEDEGLQAHARDVGAYLRAGLRDLSARHAAIGDVRGAGLFVGVEMVTDRDDKTPDAGLADRLVNDLRRRRVLISRAGAHGNVLKLRPPLPFSRANADQLLEALDLALSAMPV